MTLMSFLGVALELIVVAAVIRLLFLGIPYLYNRLSRPWAGFGEGPDRLAGTWVGQVDVQQFAQAGGGNAVAPVVQGAMLVQIAFDLMWGSPKIHGKVTMQSAAAQGVSGFYRGVSVFDPKVISCGVKVGAGGQEYRSLDAHFAPGALQVSWPDVSGTIQGVLHKGTQAEFEQLCGLLGGSQ